MGRRQIGVAHTDGQGILSIVESFFRKLRAIKNAEPRTPQTGIPPLRELLRDTRVTNLDEHEGMLEIISADTKKST